MRILITGNVFDPEQAAHLQLMGYEVHSRNEMGAENMQTALESIDIYVLAGNEIVTEEALRKANNLKLILFFGVQPETFFQSSALKFASEKGIEILPVENNSLSVAELAIGLILSVCREIPQSSIRAKFGEWYPYTGAEVKGKTAGIVGMGHIGREVARILRTMGAEVLYYSRTRKPDIEEELGVRFVELEQLLRTSDIISLHLTLSEETAGIIGWSQFDLMKCGAILINTARAQLVCYEALAEALLSERIKGAAFDGWYQESNQPYDPKEILYRENLIVTPHIGFNTFEANTRTSTRIVEIIKKQCPLH